MSRRAPSSGRKARRPIAAEDIRRLRVVSSPRVSPDGSRIAFVHRNVDERNRYLRNLWMVDVDGGCKPASFTGSGKDSFPRWSPDGSRLAFISGRNEQTGQLWTISSTGGEATVIKLRRTPIRFVRYPASTNHGMSRNGPPDLRIHPLAEIVAWLREHLGS